MKAAELKRLARRRPFRPFGVRLSNGARYFFRETGEFGAPKDFHVIFFFDQKDWALIDTENIVEILQ
jgi:hypothetical protein